jgi:hypothetical protein
MAMGHIALSVAFYSLHTGVANGPEKLLRMLLFSVANSAMNARRYWKRVKEHSAMFTTSG